MTFKNKRQQPDAYEQIKQVDSGEFPINQFLLFVH